MYRLEITVQGLPNPINKTNVRSHWTIRKKHADLWKRRVWAMVLVTKPGPPKEPLKKAKLTLIRYTAGADILDYDGLVSSFKFPIDALKHSGVIIDDKMSVIGCPEYRVEKCSRGKGKITIIVEEVAA